MVLNRRFHLCAEKSKWHEEKTTVDCDLVTYNDFRCSHKALSSYLVTPGSLLPYYTIYVLLIMWSSA